MRSLLVMLAISACLPLSTLANDEQPWNVVLFMAEDMSPHLGAYGDDVAHTPTLDALAERGTRFTNAFTTSGVCATSRAAIIMGVHANHFGAGHMRAAAGGYVVVPPPDWKAFPELLRRKGWYVVNNGKTDYQMSNTLGGAWGGPESIWDEVSADDWRGRGDGQPFFAYINLMETHENQVWPTWDITSFYKFIMAFGRIRNHLAWEHQTDPTQIVLPPYYPDTPTVRADVARHYNNIARMDSLVGEVLRQLEKDGVAHRTIVIFTSDHGDGLPRAKRWLYDSGMNVPLIVHWPGVTTPGSVNDELVSGIDLAPTILRALGLEVPAHVEGRVFVGPSQQAEPNYVFAARDRIDDSTDRVRAIRDHRFKYVRHLLPELPFVLPSGFRDQMPMMKELKELAASGQLEGAPAQFFRTHRDAEELFDTDTDPFELRNLAHDPAHRETLVRLRRVLDARLAAGNDLGLIEEDELAERFWPGGQQPETTAPAIELRDGALHIASVTPGASLLWRRPRDDRWQVYTTPLPVESTPRIEASAVRYGYSMSAEVSYP